MAPTDPEIQVVADSKGMSRTAAQVIVREIAQTLRTKESFTMVLSGGSTPRGLYTLLGTDASFRKEIEWSKVHFFWGDERHVPFNHPDSNYRMAHEMMLSRLPVPPGNVHPVKTEQFDARGAAEAYEREICTSLQVASRQIPRFDCVLLGMGPDGHTASLFPGTKAIHEQERLVVANWVEKFKTYRITMTATVFNNAYFIIFLVSGGEKAETLQRVLLGRQEPDRFPAQLIRPTQGKVLWLVDRAAASRLNL